MIKGKLHSIESFGAVDGPGIRTVFFMQGCPARCLYCHNPDSWKEEDFKEEIDAEGVLRWAERAKPYYAVRGGGVTFSGGEPLLQGEFLIEAINKLKDNGIESIIDTSGTYYDEYTRDALEACDMVLLDIKHPDPERFQIVCGRSQEVLLKTIETINELGKPIWIRNVVVPGINDTEEDILLLNDFIKEHFKSGIVKKIELLAYHTMALNKYAKLNITYRLKGVPAMDSEKLAILKESLIDIKDI